MVVEGRYEIDGVPPERVFQALGDPAILARAVPGCRELKDSGDGVYELAIDAGVGAVRGRYAGQVRIGERRPNELYEAVLEASGAPGAVHAEMRAELAAHNGGTAIVYSLDATLSGPVAGVGQRLLAGASRRNAKTFMEALERELASAEPAAATAAADAPPPAGVSGERAVPQAYPGRAGEEPAVDAFQRGVLVGFALSAGAFTLARLLERRARRR
jgi:carbon monoxide dehydrogenase subunit G